MYYVDVLNLMLLIAAYAISIPFTIIVGILGLILYYWCHKFSLLRMTKFPQFIGSHLSYDMIYTLEYVVFIYVVKQSTLLNGEQTIEKVIQKKKLC